MARDPDQRPAGGASPAELRSMLGANLRRLSESADSVSALCRELGINRTQYNRYLAGESFPRPDVLHRICTHFGVDARILLEPVEQIADRRPGGIEHPVLAGFLAGPDSAPDEERFPSGFYRFSRRSFVEDARFVQGLVYAFRSDGGAFVRGFEAREAVGGQGLSTDPATREFRGLVLAQEDGVAVLAARRAGSTVSFNHLARVPTFENNFWAGFTARTVREGVAGRRVERVVFEHLGRQRDKIMRAARGAGLCSAEALLPFHRALLKIGEPFA
jgi:transcriptional regulator with XRE-family HTH domain